jgi:hypothetical protein
VFFTSEYGAGYHTLLANKQRLTLSDTKFLVGFDSLPQSEIAKIEHKNPDHFLTDVSLLKLDYMQQKSLEMAVCVPFRIAT